MSVMGENLKGFPTQRVALEGEGQLRWVGGFPSHASRILLPSCDSLVRILACDSSCSLHSSGYECSFLSKRVLVQLGVQTATREWWEGEF